MTSPDRPVPLEARDRLPGLTVPHSPAGPAARWSAAGRTEGPAPGAMGERARRRTSERTAAQDAPEREPVQVPWLPAPPAADAGPEARALPRTAADPDDTAASGAPAAPEGTPGGTPGGTLAERTGSAPDPDDVAAVVHRDRLEALAGAAAAYTAAYGHPLDAPGEERPPGGRRWWLSLRHAVVAGAAVAVLAAGVVLRATTEVPGPPDELPPLHAVGTAGEATGTAGGAAAPWADGGAPPGADPAAPATAPAAGTGAGPAAVAPHPPRTVAPGGAGGAVGGGAGGAASGGAGGAAGAPPGPVVHVVGQVAEPGVLTLAPGARVSDAVAAAGGAEPEADLSAVNLARSVVDGEQIHVPAHGEPVREPPPGGATSRGPAEPVGGAGGAAAAAPVALNTADGATLDGLPGIGPVLAQRILDWRADNGPFRSVEELGEVVGIGDALLTRLRPLVTV